MAWYGKWDLRYDLICLLVHFVFDIIFWYFGWGTTMGYKTDQKRDVTSVEGCGLNLKNVEKKRYAGG